MPAIITTPSTVVYNNSFPQHPKYIQHKSQYPTATYRQHRTTIVEQFDICCGMQCVDDGGREEYQRDILMWRFLGY